MNEKGKHIVKKCLICQSNIYFDATGKRVICDKISCEKELKLRSQQKIRGKLKAKILAEGKDCKRCGKHVHEKGMRKYCQSCKDILNTPSVKKIKKKRDTEKCKKSMVCTLCPNEIKGFNHKLYCTDCAKKKHNESVKKHAAKKQAIAEKQPINKKFLKRGLK